MRGRRLPFRMGRAWRCPARRGRRMPRRSAGSP